MYLQYLCPVFGYCPLLFLLTFIWQSNVQRLFQSIIQSYIPIHLSIYQVLFGNLFSITTVARCAWYRIRQASTGAGTMLSQLLNSCMHHSPGLPARGLTTSNCSSFFCDFCVLCALRCFTQQQQSQRVDEPSHPHRAREATANDAPGDVSSDGPR